ncbi:hypothetical protein NDU88_004687 [Pleurodeles waltl]|uniref:Uncharacterized protein n=1 Tax=Pleurodeles waltl TaxID=8319 RepID=A0AAV7RM05_PLEWA|nr:hypothetical protein NDU88_004687 [Pleurodeles waltl]
MLRKGGEVVSGELTAQVCGGASHANSGCVSRCVSRRLGQPGELSEPSRPGLRALGTLPLPPPLSTLFGLFKSEDGLTAGRRQTYGDSGR